MSIRTPISSYGIILIYIDPNNVIWYLLAQRRDTIEYVDFIRGAYSRYNLEKQVRLMCTTERILLSKYTFDDLWDDCWIYPENYYGKEKARAKYESIKTNLACLLETNKYPVTEPGWVFPKGRKNSKESEIECAIREFTEETRIPLNYTNLLGIPPIKETFRGTNNKIYSTMYYIAKIHEPIIIEKQTFPGIRKEFISDEISNLKWARLTEALPLLSVSRQKILLTTNHAIRIHFSNARKGT